ncbi:MAG: bifunctional 2-polyprenyl-6-hydroxyphenol methylase/3-demethylubiquinol 3-O-methyltransferase UbiG [Alphaproteobacteria bacterium]|nr:bifunctional 2-polyprenyl-6-hydroxyphenol methylase/3-demethylubiquinol 3-O-methyltransferase UbiG [Alphaproteobacteria bacterium]
MSRQISSSVADDEIARFSAVSGDWWNPEGTFKSLHKLNPLRADYVRDQVCAHLGRDKEASKPLRGLTVLDVGCGGGLLAESLAIMGGRVTGVDASGETILVAKKHAKAGKLSIDYTVDSVENMAGTDAQFDLITAFEVIEHVADVQSFLKSLSKLLRPGGMLVMATLNRTKKSFLLSIVVAEYVLGWIPGGTHDWEQFVRPSDLVKHLERYGLATLDLTGMVFNPFSFKFELKPHSLDVNYLLAARKK